MYCSNCGTKISNDADFCSNCGQKTNRVPRNESKTFDVNSINEKTKQKVERRNIMVKEYKCQGGMKGLAILNITIGVLMVVAGIILAGHASEMRTYWGIGENEKRQAMIEAAIGLIGGAALIVTAARILQTKICLYQEYVELKAMTGGIDIKLEDLKLEYNQINSVSVQKHFVIVNAAGKEYKVSCGTENDAKACRNELETLIKQNS